MDCRFTPRVGYNCLSDENWPYEPFPSNISTTAISDLEVAVLILELLYLSLVAGVLLAHKRDIVGGLLQDLRTRALVPVVHAGRKGTVVTLGG